MYKKIIFQLFTLIIACFMFAGCSSTKEDTSVNDGKEKIEEKQEVVKEVKEKESVETQEAKAETTASTSTESKTKSTPEAATTQSKTTSTATTKSNAASTQKQPATSKPATGNNSGSTQSSQSNNSGYKPGLNEDGSLTIEWNPDSYYEFNNGNNYSYMSFPTEIPKEWADNPDFWE